jgi:hypothetical protein
MPEIDVELQNLRRFISERISRENTFINEVKQQIKAILDSLEECYNELRIAPVSGPEEQAKIQELSTGIQAAIQHLNDDFPVGNPGELVESLDLRGKLKRKKTQSLRERVFGTSTPVSDGTKKPGFFSRFMGKPTPVENPVENPIRTERNDFGLDDDAPYPDGVVRHGDNASLGGWKTPKRKKRRVTKRRTSFS